MADNAKPSRSSSETRISAPKEPKVRRPSGSSWNESSWHNNSWSQSSPSSWQSDSWKQSGSWQDKQWQRPSSTGRVSRPKPDRANRSDAKSGNVDLFARKSSGQKQKKLAEVPFQPSLDMSSQQFPDLKASLTGDAPQHKKKLMLPRAGSNTRLRAPSDGATQDDRSKVESKKNDDIAKLKASAAELGKRFAEVPTSKPVVKPQVQCDLEEDVGRPDECHSTKGDHQPEGASAETFDADPTETAEDAAECESTEVQTSICKASDDIEDADAHEPETIGAIASNETSNPDTSEPVEDAAVDESIECQTDNIEDADAHEPETIDTSEPVEDAAVDESIECQTDEVKTSECDGAEDVGVPKGGAVERGASMEEGMADTSEVIEGVDESGRSVTQQLPCGESDISGDADGNKVEDSIGSQGMTVAERKALFTKTVTNSGFEQVIPKKEAPQQPHQFVAPVKRITSGSSADSYLDRLARDREIQRIRSCRAAAAVLDLPQGALGDQHAVTIAYLARAYLLHSFPVGGENAGDAQGAITLLSAAYRHCVMGAVWRHGVRDESQDDRDESESAEEDDFEMFRRVAQTAIDGGELEPSLVASCQAVLNNPRTAE